ncbi:hypothetical protein TPY_3194 [Sulfobacillus acidophilus TPY]|uniref:Uncharacterized protein n=1 Tax=Sulfobacillus acidophilus (strain ATCC 700253 / DSM 10332 / NAL) TaxID=679936 RepID=G8TZH5_SULAD|nr:hypothetical protein TPY_3194 [Sulfobacillus acidophilus TPY]AEW05215.1 hypothetical protein Sulac_1719 [Sulfobacillus acidophilus DSM 10332]
MGEILNSGMMWRGYNTADPNNSYATTTAGTALTQGFTQYVNRVIVYNLGPVPLYVKFGGVAASNTSYDIVLPPRTGFAGGLNTNAVSVYSADAVTVYIGGFREDNTSI